jgi:epoxyqueuosine reductase QueG
MKHTTMNEIAFSKEIKETPTFKGFEKFKQGIVMRRANVVKLYDKYLQAIKFGVDYIKQNPNNYANDIKIIEEIILRNEN